MTERLRTPEDYELITYQMIRELAAQGVVHAEVYISFGIILLLEAGPKSSLMSRLLNADGCAASATSA